QCRLVWREGLPAEPGLADVVVLEPLRGHRQSAGDVPLGGRLAGSAHGARLAGPARRGADDGAPLRHPHGGRSEAPMSRRTADLRRLSRELIEAFRARDREAMERILADDFRHVDAGGADVNRERFVETMIGAPWRIRSI